MSELLIKLLNDYKCSSPVINNIKSKKPTIIVPDIHARIEFLEDVVFTYDPNRYNIVFTGDILHSEGKNNHWAEIEDDYLKTGKFTNPWMGYEVMVNLECLKLILLAQSKFPESVFFLRGNHDDMSCTIQGDYGKYARRYLESRLFREYLEDENPEVLKAYYKFEKKIPYLYVGHEFIASHTIPDEKVELREIKFNEPRTHWRFSWADNTNKYNGCITHFEGNLHRLGSNAKYWFCGHRPVPDPDLLRIQCGGRLVQNNHPEKHVVIEKPYEGMYNASLLQRDLDQTVFGPIISSPTE